MKPLLKSAELAAILRVTPATLWRLSIPSVKVGRNRLYDVRDVEAWLDERKQDISEIGITGPIVIEPTRRSNKRKSQAEIQKELVAMFTATSVRKKQGRAKADAEARRRAEKGKPKRQK